MSHPKPLVDEAVRLCEEHGLVPGLMNGWVCLPGNWSHSPARSKSECQGTFSKRYTLAGLLRFIDIASETDTRAVVRKLCGKQKAEVYE